MPIDIRTAIESDLGAINFIYNHFVRTSTCTYQETPDSLDERREWFRGHDDQHPVIVAESDGQVIGWGSLSTFHPRSAYRHTVENSVYVHHEHHRHGIGSLLMQELIVRAREEKHHAVIAGIDAEQVGSMALHTKFGFEKVGHLKQVGFKFNRWLDVIYMELVLTNAKG